MKRKLLIIGASGHGKVVADIALKMNKWEEIRFLDTNKDIVNCVGFEVLFDDGDYKKYLNDYEFFVAIGHNAVRKKILNQLFEFEAIIATLVHPNAVIGLDVVIDQGTVVMGGVVINPSTRIGKGCIINTSSSIDHDCRIDDYVHISPGVRLAGTVTIGSNCWIGVGTVISNNVVLNTSVNTGAGTIVIKDIVESGIYIGCPSRRLEK